MLSQLATREKRRRENKTGTIIILIKNNEIALDANWSSFVINMMMKRRDSWPREMLGGCLSHRGESLVEYRYMKNNNIGNSFIFCYSKSLQFILEVNT